MLCKNVITLLYCSLVSIDIFEVTLPLVTKLLDPKILGMQLFSLLTNLLEDTAALEMFGIF